MLLEALQPVSLLLSILSLYSTFHAAFLASAVPVGERLRHALVRLAFAGAISLVAGMLFREAEVDADVRFDAEFRAWFGGRPPAASAPPLLRMLPVQLFCWAAAAMAVLFFLSWYLETYFVLYRDVRY